MSFNRAIITLAAQDTPDVWKADADIRCDGANDEVEINDAIANKVPSEGGVVVLLPGQFNVGIKTGDDHAILIKRSNVELHLCEGCRVRLRDNDPEVESRDCNVIQINEVSTDPDLQNITISGLGTIDYNGDSGAGYSWDGSNGSFGGVAGTAGCIKVLGRVVDLKFTDFSVVHSPARAIGFQGASANSEAERSDRVLLRNIRFYDAGEGLTFGQAQNVLIIGCHFDNIGQDAMEPVDVYRVSIVGCSFTNINDTGSGIDFFCTNANERCQDIQVVGCHFEGSSTVATSMISIGVNADNATALHHRITISGCTFYPGGLQVAINIGQTNTRGASDLATTQDVVISGCMIDGSNQQTAGTKPNGIEVGNGARNILITGCVIRDISGHGIELDGTGSAADTDHITICGCDIFDCDRGNAGASAIVVANDVDVVYIQGNRLFDSGVGQQTYGVDMTNADGGGACTVYMHNNIFHGNVTGTHTDPNSVLNTTIIAATHNYGA